MNSQKSVLLALGYYFADLVSGIVAHARKNNWRLVFLRGVCSEEGLRQWRGDGLISSFPEDVLSCRGWKNTKIVSLIRFKHTMLPGSLVRENDYEIGKIAAEFFLRRGHIHFAAYSDTRRLDGFRDALQSYGYDCSDLLPGEKAWRPEKRISQWLVSLPKPSAVFCENDWDAAELISLAHWNQIEIPRDLSILGVGDDRQVCTISEQTLSSIDSRLYEVGRSAAEELERLMNGGSPDQIFISPNPFVAERRSTDFVYSDDQRLSEIVEWMKKQVEQSFTIESMARMFALSESALYKMFVRNLKLSPKQFLLDLRLKRACELLQNGTLTTELVASRCGFPTVCGMFSAFRKRFGCAPGEWRKQRLSFQNTFFR